MAARRPALRDPGNPFSVSNASFGAFSLSGGQDPARKALEDASEARYSVGLRYNNGQATNEEYLAAIEAELRAAQVLAGSQDADVAQTGRRRVAELENLKFDIGDRTAEANARAGGDESLLAYYQGRIGSMAPGTPAYLSMQEAITNLQERITGQREADASRKAGYDLAMARASYENGTIDDAQWLAALRTYSGAQKAGTAAAVEAQQTVIQWEHSIGRNRIVSAIEQGEAEWDDLLAFDKEKLGQLNPGSEAYRDALAAYQNTQEHVLAELEKNADGTGVLDRYQDGKLNAGAALAWYKDLLAGPMFDDNPAMQQAIGARIRDFTANAQAETDNLTIDAYNKGTLGPQDFMAYSKSRAATYAQGTQDWARWNGHYESARNAQIESTLDRRYNLSQEIVQLQIFIAKNSGPLTGGTSTSRQQVMTADGGFRYIDVTKGEKPSPAEVEAWQQRQAEVANAKVRLAGLTEQVAAAGGFISTKSRLDYFTRQQGGVEKGTPKWFEYQRQIDGLRDRQNYEEFLSTNDGIKIGYPGVTAAGAAARTAAGSSSGGGSSTGARPGTARGGGGADATASTGGRPTSTGPAQGARQVGGTPIAGKPRNDVERAALSMMNQLDVPMTQEMFNAFVAWIHHEQGSFTIRGNNPGNQHARKGQASYYAGPRDTNVAIYGSLDEGVAVNVANLLRNRPGGKDPYGYQAVVDAARSGDPDAFFTALGASSWAESRYGGSGAPNLRARYESLFGSAVPSAADLPSAPTGTTQGAAERSAAAAARTGASNITVDQLLRAIRQRESGGDYAARNSATGAFGAYQWTPAEWSRYAGKYLGDPSKSPTPQNQDAVARKLATELYGQYGSWESVAHWWLTGGPATAGHADPATWSSVERYYVADLIVKAGGTLPTVPTTSVTAPRGTGIRGPLEIEVGAIVGPDGVRQSITIPVDFPHNMDADAFESLYQGVVGAALGGSDQLTFTHRTGNGDAIAFSLPDTPAEHYNLIEDLDRRRINSAAAEALDKVGTDQFAAAENRLTTAYRQSGANALTLLDLSYGGRDPKTGLTKSTVALPPTPKRTSLEGSNPLEGDLRRFDVQTPNPIAAGIALTEHTEVYVRTQTQIAQQAWAAGAPEVALHALKNVTDATNEHSLAITRIESYNTVAGERIKQINAATGAELRDAPGAAQGMEVLSKAGERLAAAAEPGEKLYQEIAPFIVTDRGGAPAFDADGSVVLRPGVAWYADARSDGTIAVTPKQLPPTDAFGGREDPGRVDVWVPGFNGRPRSAKAEWVLGDVGTLYTPNPNGGYSEVKIKGRVAQLGDGWYENPFEPGRWSPNAMTFVARNATIEPAVMDSKGNADPNRFGIAWADGTGNQYRIGYDEKSGAMIVYQLRATAPTTPAGKATYELVPLAGTQAKQALALAGVGLDPARNSRDTLAWQLAPDLGDGLQIRGAWVGYDYEQARDFVYGPHAKKAGAAIAATATAAIRQFGRDPLGSIMDGLRFARALVAPGDYTGQGPDVLATGMLSPGQPGGDPRRWGWEPVQGMEWLRAVGTDRRTATYGGVTYLEPVNVAQQRLGIEANTAASITLREVTGAPPIVAPVYESIRRPTPVVAQGDVVAAGAGVPRPTLTPVTRTVTPTTGSRPVAALGAGAGAAGTAPVKVIEPGRAVVTTPKPKPTTQAQATTTIKPITRPPTTPTPTPTKTTATGLPVATPKPKPKPVVLDPYGTPR